MISGINSENAISIADVAESHESENSSECPEELYNLTKLAEVAVATGQIQEQRKLLSTNAASITDQTHFNYTHKLFDKSSRASRPHLIKVRPHFMFVLHYKLNHVNI